jgi:hypothetical protein
MENSKTTFFTELPSGIEPMKNPSDLVRSKGCEFTVSSAG